MEKKLSRDRIFGLDLMRSFAILLVMFSHIFFLIDSSSSLLISLCAIAGFAGVELFFVLSGYLIGTILLREYINDGFSLQSVFRFLKRRWFRTLPNYYLILLLNLGIVYFLGYSLAHWYRYFFFFQNFKTNYIGFFSESWSLSIEEWTYVLLPFSLLFVLKLTHRFSKKHSFLFAIFLLIILAHIFRYFNMLNSEITTMEKWDLDIKSIVVYRFDIIFYGAVLAWLHYFYATFLNSYKVYFLIIAVHLFVIQFLVLNVLGVDIISSKVYFMVFYFTLSASIYSLILPCFIFWKNSKPLITEVVTFLSRISYGAYLLHYGIVTVVIKYSIYEFSLELPASLIILVYFATTFFLSYILYRFFEKPIMDLRDKN